MHQSLTEMIARQWNQLESMDKNNSLEKEEIIKEVMLAREINTCNNSTRLHMK